MKKFLKLLPFVLFIALVVAADQVSKYFVVEYLKPIGSVEFIPGFLSWTYAENIGAAWSMMQGMRWVFVGLFAVLTVLVILEYFKFRLPFTSLDRWFIAAIYAGGLGNAIDRARLGYVVDMIKTEFIEFPIFNVADCFITCGCIALLISLVFFNKNFWKEKEK